MLTVEQIEKNRQKFLELERLQLPLGQYAITGSGPLGIRHLREIGDIDIIVNLELWNVLAARYGVTIAHNIKKVVFPGKNIEAFFEGSFYTLKKDILDPTILERIAKANIIEELPFESLEHVLYYKRKMSRAKDLRDVDIIENFFKKISV